MTMINSVLGPMDTPKLGFTLMHEHIMFGFPSISDYPELLGCDPLKRGIESLKKAKEGGIDTIVDATTSDLGRDVTMLAEVSRRSDVNIIATTGWWLETPRLLSGIPIDKLAKAFIRDIQKGIRGTDIKAGMLKSASDISGLQPEEEPMLRAVARAHLETGVPLMIHSYAPGQVGLQQMAILREEGVDLKRVKIDHCNDTTDIEYLLLLLEQGCYLGLDRYPGLLVSSLARTKTMKALMDAGYVDRICPSHDWGVSIVEEVFSKAYGKSEGERLRQNPYDYLYIKKVVFPQLREMGASEEQIGRLCITAPRNFFEGI